MVVLTTFSLWLLHFMLETRYENTKTKYKQALARATQDATTVMLNRRDEDAVNHTYEGYEVDRKAVPIDHQEVLDQFYNTLWYNLGLYGRLEEQNAFKMNIPVKGVVANDGIYISMYNDAWLPGSPYVYYDRTAEGIYYFTLGEEVTYFDISTGQEEELTLDMLMPPSTDMTIETFRDTIVMGTINQALTEAASSRQNLTAQNWGRGIEFLLPAFDYNTSNGTHTYNSRGNSIQSPGVFAILDGVQIGIQHKPLRLASFGGAQLEWREYSR